MVLSPTLHWYSLLPLKFQLKDFNAVSIVAAASESSELRMDFLSILAFSAFTQSHFLQSNCICLLLQADNENMPASINPKINRLFIGRRLADAFDVGPEFAQAFIDLLIAAVDLFYILYHALALCAQRCNEQGHTGTYIRTAHGDAP